MTEGEFLTCLRQKYGGKDYVLIPQVRNQTGFNRHVRTADALAVSLWPSRGIDVHGFEFKDSRADWLKELKEPAKAEEIGRFCSFWWLVVSDPAIFTPDELPPLWGAIHATGGTVNVLKKAPRREAQEPTWVFVAAVLRAASEVVTDEAQIQKRINAAVAAQADSHYKSLQQATQRARESVGRELETLQRRIAAFEEASGVDILDWRQPEKIGRAVRLVLDGGIESLRGSLDAIAQQAERVRQAARLDEVGQ